MIADEMAKNWQQCTLAEAMDELDREAKVRMRCFPKWVDEGRISQTEARDRLRRLLKAGALLAGLDASGAAAQPEEIPFGNKTVDSAAPAQ